jgi:putative lipoic acid-binding regulatory protein
MPDRDDSPLQFPCDFPIKIMGRNNPDFEVQVLSLIRRHVLDLGEGAVRSRTSRHDKYLSVTVTVRAASRIQLDAIYRDLTACEAVLVVL